MDSGALFFPTHKDRGNRRFLVNKWKSILRPYSNNKGEQKSCPFLQQKEELSFFFMDKQRSFFFFIKEKGVFLLLVHGKRSILIYDHIVELSYSSLREGGAFPFFIHGQGKGFY